MPPRFGVLFLPLIAMTILSQAKLEPGLASAYEARHRIEFLQADDNGALLAVSREKPTLAQRDTIACRESSPPDCSFRAALHLRPVFP